MMKMKLKRTIKLGIKGLDVKACKRGLAIAGFGLPFGKWKLITSLFGPFSVTFTKKFQKKNKLPIDGVIGQSTLDALWTFMDALAKSWYAAYPSAPPVPAYIMPMVGWNDCGGPCAHVHENGPNDIWQDNSAHDLCIKGGTKVFAVTTGTIHLGSSQSAAPGGHAVGITLHSDVGPNFYYAHMTGDSSGNSISRVLPVKDGQHVVTGTLLAYTNRWDAHLHLAVDYLDGQVNSTTCSNPKVDPLTWLK